MARFSVTIICAAAFAVFLSASDMQCAAPADSRIAVSVDPRIELYSVVLYLSGFNGPAPQAPMLNEYDLDYKKAIESRFGGFRDHAAVKLYREMGPAGFWLGHPPTVMLHLSSPDELAGQYPVDTLQVQLAGGREKLEAFLAALRDFSSRSRFMEFFAGQDSAYAMMVRRFRTGLDDGLVGELEEYYGARQHSYSIILAPVFMSGGYGPRVRVDEGVYDSYFIYGPTAVEGSTPVFENYVPYMLQHEFSHSFVNHLTERNLDRLLVSCNVLLGDQRQQFEQEAGAAWWPVHVADQVSENVVRAVTSRLIRQRETDAAGLAAAKHETEEGFPWVTKIYDRLAEYETARDKYPTFKDFFPRIVETFEEAAREKAAGR
jgi:hypothetical protein